MLRLDDYSGYTKECSQPKTINTEQLDLFFAHGSLLILLIAAVPIAKTPTTTNDPLLKAFPIHLLQ